MNNPTESRSNSSDISTGVRNIPDQQPSSRLEEFYCFFNQADSIFLVEMLNRKIYKDNICGIFRQLNVKHITVERCKNIGKELMGLTQENPGKIDAGRPGALFG